MDNTGEIKFKQWLEKNNIPYMYFDQNFDTYSSVFRGFARRPDFMLLLPNFGFILVDVEDRKPHKIYNRYCLNIAETIKYSNLQRFFNLQVWYVVSNEMLNYDTWYWISVSSLLEKRLERFNENKPDRAFFALEPNQFIQISSNDSLSRLFENMFMKK